MHPSHRHDNTYHGFWYTSRGARVGTRNSLMGPQWRIDPTIHRTMSERSYHGATSCSLLKLETEREYPVKGFDPLTFCTKQQHLTQICCAAMCLYKDNSTNWDSITVSWLGALCHFVNQRPTGFVCCYSNRRLLLNATESNERTAC